MGFITPSLAVSRCASPVLPASVPLPAPFPVLMACPYAPLHQQSTAVMHCCSMQQHSAWQQDTMHYWATSWPAHLLLGRVVGQLQHGIRRCAHAACAWPDNARCRVWMSVLAARQRKMPGTRCATDAGYVVQTLCRKAELCGELLFIVCSLQVALAAMTITGEQLCQHQKSGISRRGRQHF